MDWIRRNWPDLLIGVALVAVIAMIVATLLSGGSLTSLLRRNTAPEIPITNTTGSENTQTTETPTTTETSGTSGTETSGANGADGSASEGTGAQNEGLDVFVPGTTDAPDTAETQGGAATAENTAGQDGDTAPTQQTAGAAVNAPLPESVPNGGFRVAAGAVDSRDGALAAAQTFRDAGYTVTIEPQDDLYLLWIGPYASDAGAERVVARLQQDGLVPDALVYTYDPNDATAQADNAGAANAETADAANNTAVGTQAANSANTNATTTTSATGANAGDAATTPATAADDLTPPAGQQFLQVGAYSSDERAEPQRAQLEQLGLTVTSDEDDDGMVRLYVGPFAGAQLAQTRNRLSSQGIDSFPVTP